MSDERDLSRALTVSIELLTDHPQLVPAVGEIRWREWGHAPEPDSLDWWVNITAREAGREDLPVTWVAIDAQGYAVGARHDCSQRATGVGRWQRTHEVLGRLGARP